MTPRQNIISRVSKALSGITAPARNKGPLVLQRESVDPKALIRDFSERWERVGGVVHRAGDQEELALVFRDLFFPLKGKTVAVTRDARTLAPDLDTWLERLGVETVLPYPDQAKEAGAGVTSARGFLAYSGSLLVSSQDPGEISASLLPPLHVALVPSDRFIQDLAGLLAFHQRPDRPRALVTITGPSRTADIELTLVKGVHGPQATHVVLLDQSWP